MKFTISILLKTWLLSMYVFFVQAQPKKDTVKVQIAAKVKENSIILRWAPFSVKAWEYGNRWGYKVDKYVIVKNGKLLPKPEISTLADLPLKPQPESAFGEVFNRTKDPILALGAQALYGKNFEIKAKDPSLKEIIDKDKETENRFGFALFSADQSTEVAALMGLKISDNNISKGDKYLYKVYIPVNFQGIQPDTGYVYVDAGIITRYSAPKNYFAVFGDKLVKLSWDIRLHKDFFSSYQVERKEEGKKEWEVRNTQPFVPMSPTGRPAETAVYYDSLPKNIQVFHYRIKCKDYFGEFCEEVMTFAGAGRPVLTSRPEITSITPLEKKSAAVMWTFPEQEQKNVLSFIIYVSKKPKGNYKKLVKTKSTERGAAISVIQGYNYYKIGALGVDSNEYFSPSILFQLDDEIPPHSPVGLHGSIDTLGIVKIKWKKNAEQDMFGYRVFKANSRNDEFVNISKKMDKDTLFMDTVTLNTLSQKIYYKVTALDNRFNQSDYSEILELKRPDRMAPSAPVIASYLSNEKYVQIEWIGSTSLDIKGHLLIRSLAGTNEWNILFKYSPTITGGVFRDSSGQTGAYYEYGVVAVDDANNETYSNLIKITRTDLGIRPGCDKVSAKANRAAVEIELKWKSPAGGEVLKTLIYRAKAGEPSRLYEHVPGNQTAFKDKKVAYGSRYVYRVRSMYADGGSSPLSEKITVEF